MKGSNSMQGMDKKDAVILYRGISTKGHTAEDLLSLPRFKQETA